jgi:hypothetical protein
MAKIFRRYKSTIYGNYRKSYLIYGMVTGIAMFVILFVRDWMSDSPMSQPENFITELVMGVGIFLFTYRYREQLPDKKVTLKELMLLGLGIGVVGSVIYGLLTWVNCGSINTELVEFYNQERISVMEPAESSAEAKAAVELVKKYTAGDWAFIGGFRSAVMSIILTFFAALIFRTEKSPVVERNKK